MVGRYTHHDGSEWTLTRYGEVGEPAFVIEESHDGGKACFSLPRAALVAWIGEDCVKRLEGE